MRILVITPYLPWPLNSGGNAAQFSTLKCLARDHQFVVVCPLHQPGQLAAIAQLKRELPEVRFVGVADYSQPQYRSRFLQIARDIYRSAREFFLSPANSSPPLPDYPFNLAPASLLAAVALELEKGADICQVEFVEMLALGAWLPKNIPKLFIHPQIHFVYARRFIEAKGDASGYAGYLEAVIRAQEVAYLNFFEAVVTFSREDQKILQSLPISGEVIASPFPVPADIHLGQEIPDGFDGSFFFVASETHSPNRDALEWLLASIWPKISKALPSATLQIVGDWTEKTKRQKAGPAIVFTGFIEDISSTLQGGIMLVPVRIGSGIRVKILIALALGVPVVSTTIGNEGIEILDGREILLRDDPDDFAAAAIELARNPALWRSLAIAGKDAVQKNYSPETVRIRRNQIYERLLARTGVQHK